MGRPSRWCDLYFVQFDINYLFLSMYSRSAAKTSHTFYIYVVFIFLSIGSLLWLVASTAELKGFIGDFGAVSAKQGKCRKFLSSVDSICDGSAGRNTARWDGTVDQTDV